MAQLLRRLFDEPTAPPKGADRRTEERMPRIRPVMLAPQFDGQPAVAEAQFAMTSDITSRGLAAYIAQPIHAEQAYVGLHFDGQGHLFLATVRSASQAGGGFHRIGLEFLQIADPDAPGIDMLRSLTVGLSLAAGPKIDPLTFREECERSHDREYRAARQSLYEALEDIGISND